MISFELKNLTSMPPNTFNFTVDYGLLVHDYRQMCAPLLCKFPVKVSKGFWKTFKKSTTQQQSQKEQSENNNYFCIHFNEFKATLAGKLKLPILVLLLRCGEC